MFFRAILNYSKPVAFLLAFLLLSMPVMAQMGSSDCTQAKIDGKADGKSKASPAWFLAGLGCGCLGVGAAFLIKPSVPSDKIMGKSAEYIVCYEQEYKKAAAGKQAGYALVGWIVWILIYTIAILPSSDS